MALMVGDVVARFVADLSGMDRAFRQLQQRLNTLSAKIVQVQLRIPPATFRALLSIETSLKKIGGVARTIESVMISSVDSVALALTSAGFRTRRAISNNVSGIRKEIAQVQGEIARDGQQSVTKFYRTTAAMGSFVSFLLLGLVSDLDKALVSAGSLTGGFFSSVTASSKGAAKAAMSPWLALPVSIGLAIAKVAGDVWSFVSKESLNILGVTADKSVSIISGATVEIGGMISNLLASVGGLFDSFVATYTTNVKGILVGTVDLIQILFRGEEALKKLGITAAAAWGGILAGISTVSLGLFGLTNVVGVLFTKVFQLGSAVPTTIFGKAIELTAVLYSAVVQFISPITIIINRSLVMVGVLSATTGFVLQLWTGTATLLGGATSLFVLIGLMRPILFNMVNIARLRILQVSAALGNGKSQFILFVRSMRDAFSIVQRLTSFFSKFRSFDFLIVGAKALYKSLTDIQRTMSSIFDWLTKMPAVLQSSVAQVALIRDGFDTLAGRRPGAASTGGRKRTSSSTDQEQSATRQTAANRQLTVIDLQRLQVNQMIHQQMLGQEASKTRSLREANRELYFDRLRSNAIDGITKDWQNLSVTITRVFEVASITLTAALWHPMRNVLAAIPAGAGTLLSGFAERVWEYVSPQLVKVKDEIVKWWNKSFESLPVLGGLTKVIGGAFKILGGLLRKNLSDVGKDSASGLGAIFSGIGKTAVDFLVKPIASISRLLGGGDAADDQDVRDAAEVADTIDVQVAKFDGGMDALSIDFWKDQYDRGVISLQKLSEEAAKLDGQRLRKREDLERAQLRKRALELALAKDSTTADAARQNLEAFEAGMGQADPEASGVARKGFEKDAKQIFVGIEEAAKKANESSLKAFTTRNKLSGAENKELRETLEATFSLAKFRKELEDADNKIAELNASGVFAPAALSGLTQQRQSALGRVQSAEADLAQKKLNLPLNRAVLDRLAEYLRGLAAGALAGRDPAGKSASAETSRSVAGLADRASSLSGQLEAGQLVKLQEFINDADTAASKVHHHQLQLDAINKHLTKLSDSLVKMDRRSIDLTDEMHKLDAVTASAEQSMRAVATLKGLVGVGAAAGIPQAELQVLADEAAASNAGVADPDAREKATVDDFHKLVKLRVEQLRRDQMEADKGYREAVELRNARTLARNKLTFQQRSTITAVGTATTTGPDEVDEEVKRIRGRARPKGSVVPASEADLVRTIDAYMRRTRGQTALGPSGRERAPHLAGILWGEKFASPQLAAQEFIRTITANTKTAGKAFSDPRKLQSLLTNLRNMTEEGSFGEETVRLLEEWLDEFNASVKVMSKSAETVKKTLDKTTKEGREGKKAIGSTTQSAIRTDASLLIGKVLKGATDETILQFIKTLRSKPAFSREYVKMLTEVIARSYGDGIINEAHLQKIVKMLAHGALAKGASQEVSDAIGKVLLLARENLPQSPPKRGPLKGNVLPKAGGLIVKMIAEGVFKAKAELEKVMSKTLLGVYDQIPHSFPTKGPLKGDMLVKSGGQIVEFLSLGLIKRGGTIATVFGRILKIAFSFLMPGGLLISGSIFGINLIFDAFDKLRRLVDNPIVNAFRKVATELRNVGLEAARIGMQDRVSEFDAFSKTLQILGGDAQMASTMFITLRENIARMSTDQGLDVLRQFGQFLGADTLQEIQSGSLSLIDVWKKLAAAYQRAMEAGDAGGMSSILSLTGGTAGAGGGAVFQKSSDEIEKVHRQVLGLGIAIDNSMVKRADDFMQAFETTRLSIEAFINAIMIQLSPIITNAFKDINVAWQSVSKQVMTGIKVIGKIAETVSATIQRKVNEWIADPKKLFADFVAGLELVMQAGLRAVEAFFKHALPIVGKAAEALWNLVWPIFDRLFSRFVEVEVPRLTASILSMAGASVIQFITDTKGQFSRMFDWIRNAARDVDVWMKVAGIDTAKALNQISEEEANRQKAAVYSLAYDPMKAAIDDAKSLLRDQLNLTESAIGKVGKAWLRAWSDPNLNNEHFAKILNERLALIEAARDKSGGLLHRKDTDGLSAIRQQFGLPSDTPDVLVGLELNKQSSAIRNVQFRLEKLQEAQKKLNELKLRDETGLDADQWRDRNNQLSKLAKTVSDMRSDADAAEKKLNDPLSLDLEAAAQVVADKIGDIGPMLKSMALDFGKAVEPAFKKFFKSVGVEEDVKKVGILIDELIREITAAGVEMDDAQREALEGVKRAADESARAVAGSSAVWGNYHRALTNAHQALSQLRAVDGREVLTLAEKRFGLEEKRLDVLSKLNNAQLELKRTEQLGLPADQVDRARVAFEQLEKELTGVLAGLDKLAAHDALSMVFGKDEAMKKFVLGDIGAETRKDTFADEVTQLRGEIDAADAATQEAYGRAVEMARLLSRNLVGEAGDFYREIVEAFDKSVGSGLLNDDSNNALPTAIASLRRRPAVLDRDREIRQLLTDWDSGFTTLESTANDLLKTTLDADASVWDLAAQRDLKAAEMRAAELQVQQQFENFRRQIDDQLFKAEVTAGKLIAEQDRLKVLLDEALAAGGDLSREEIAELDGKIAALEKRLAALRGQQVTLQAERDTTGSEDAEEAAKKLASDKIARRAADELGNTVGNAIGTGLQSGMVNAMRKIQQAKRWTEVVGAMFRDVSSELFKALSQSLTQTLAKDLSASLGKVFKELGVSGELGKTLATTALFVASAVAEAFQTPTDQINATREAIEGVTESAEQVRGVISGETQFAVKEMSDVWKDVMVPTNNILLRQLRIWEMMLGRGDIGLSAVSP